MHKEGRGDWIQEEYNRVGQTITEADNTQGQEVDL